MNRIDKMNMLRSLGYSYEQHTGLVYNKQGKELNTTTGRYKIIRLYNNKIPINVTHHQFGYWWVNGTCPDVIDHINRDRLDNRIDNLRPSTSLKNGQNIEPGKGYSYHKRVNKFQARIRINGKLKALGYYLTEKEANDIYLEAKSKYHIHG
jgi:hypothetical protein